MNTLTTHIGKYQKRSLILLLSALVLVIAFYYTVKNVEFSSSYLLLFLFFLVILLIPSLSILSIIYAAKSIKAGNKRIKDYLLAVGASLVVLPALLIPIASINAFVGVLDDRKKAGTTAEEMPDKPAVIMPIPAPMIDMANQEAYAYLDEVVETNKNAVRTESGLIYEILEHGDSSRPKSDEDTLIMEWEFLHRSGKRVATIDGSETGVIHREYPLKDMMPGMAEGVMLIGKGGKIKLYIPPNLVHNDGTVHIRETIFIVAVKDIVRK